MLEFITVLIMAGVAYVYLGEGLFTAFMMFCGVVAAGLVTFDFYEPLAGVLASTFSGSLLSGYEDAMAMTLLFSLTLGAFRVTANNLCPFQVEYHPLLQSIGGGVFGLVTGYLVSGFLVCMLQTLPWRQDFLGFKYDAPSALRQVLPADRVWLALMRRAGAYAFTTGEDPAGKDADSYYDRYITFDRFANFELRYARYRRYDNDNKRRAYAGEFDNEVGRPLRGAR